MVRKLFYILTLSFTLLIITNIFSQPTFKLNQTEIRNASVKLDSMAKLKTGRDTPGYSIMVIYNGKKIFNKGFGLANLKTGRQLDSHSNLYLASVSKEFTTMAIMILHDRGLIGFDDPVIKYLHGLPSYYKNITVRNLMTHTSGIPDYYALLGYNYNFTGITNKDVWNLLLKQDSLNFKPGTKFQYSNSGFVLLSMIVSKVSHKSFAEFLKKNIFNKIGMKNTLVITPRVKTIPHRATGYTKDSTGQYIKDDYDQYTTGAGGIYSCTSDLYKWDQSLYTDKLVKKSTLNEAFTRQSLNNGKKIDYGFGWFIGKFTSGNLKGIKFVYHNGALDGFRNLIFRIPALHFSYIVLSNTGQDFSVPEAIAKLFWKK